MLAEKKSYYLQSIISFDSPISLIKIFLLIDTVSFGTICKMILHYSIIQVLATLAYISKKHWNRST